MKRRVVLIPIPLPCAAVLIAVASMAVGPANAQQADPVQSPPDAAAREQSGPPGDSADPAADAEESIEIPVRLLERPPFDRVTLDAENGNAVIETVLLDLPARRLPETLPREGELELHRLSQPSIPYAVKWSAIAKIELYEQMLLEEAMRLTEAGQFGEAFEYFAFLTMNYPGLPGLEPRLQAYLWREASTAFAAGNAEEAWPVLIALYKRNPQYPRLVNAVQAVSDRLINERLERADYAGARAVVDGLQENFRELELANLPRWRQRFAQDAQEQLAKARAALANEDYTAARVAATFAATILPDLPGAAELLRQIQAAAPEIRVGVTQFAAPAPPTHCPTFAEARVAGLTDPTLVAMSSFAAEGGVYECRYGGVKTLDTGLETIVSLRPESLQLGLTPDVAALELAEMARGESPHHQPDFAANLAGIRLASGVDLIVKWRSPHLKPEAFLQLPLRRLAEESRADGLWFERPTSPEGEAEPAAGVTPEFRYRRSGGDSGRGADAPRYIVERLYEDDDAAIDALNRGEVDVLDRVPPWQVAQLRGAKDVVVAAYRLPTVHVLIPNLENDLVEMREFRRALCYGLDRRGIVEDILLAGESQAGFVALSGAMPAGNGLNDPVGYGYNGDIQPRPYEPRLAALLAAVARSTLAKREAEARKAEEAAATAKAKAAEPLSDADSGAAKAEAEEDAAESSDEGATETDDSGQPKLPPMQPLVLAHDADPLARLACQTIKLQLDQIGISVKLVEVPADGTGAEIKYDLRYAELSVTEPLVDARRLYGRRGVTGRPTALMDAALTRLDGAENWNQAREQLKEIHRIAHYDLPLIPLWQTVNHLAYRKDVAGVGEAPIALYQNVSAWRKAAP